MSQGLFGVAFCESVGDANNVKHPQNNEVTANVNLVRLAFGCA
jgi:hypothetical protein